MTKEKEYPYFKLSTNEYGKHWLFYKPLESEPGKYGCWMPIDDEFYSEFRQIQNQIQSLTEQLEAKDDEMNGLIEIHHEQCKELELEIQSLKEQLQKAKELCESKYDEGYHVGYTEASSEAIQEIHKNYHPNNTHEKS